MARKRIRAKSAASARRKGTGKETVVTKVNYIIGSRRKGVGTYSVTTKQRRHKAPRRRHRRHRKR